MTVVSVKPPGLILERIPAARQGRSRFIMPSSEQEIARQPTAEGERTTIRGRLLVKLLEAGKAGRYPRLNEQEFERELRERRGRDLRRRSSTAAL